MEIETIREFLTLAGCRNYNKAAKQLFISQPTLSRHIRELEADIGVPLFTRSTRKVELTEFGAYFLPYANKIVDTENQYLSGIAATVKRQQNSISVGYISLLELSIADLASEITSANKDIDFTATKGASEDLRRGLREGTFDFIFIREVQPYKDPDLSRIQLFHTPPTLIMPKQHPLAKKKQIDISMLKDEKFLMTEDDALTTVLAPSLSREAGFDLNIVFHGTREQVLRLVDRGVGVSLVFLQSGEISYDNICSAALSSDTVAEINCIYDANKTATSRICTDFIDLIRSFNWNSAF